MTQRRDSLGRARRPEQDATTFRPLAPGRVSRSHNLNMTPADHAALAALTPVQRGDLIAAALRRGARSTRMICR